MANQKTGASRKRPNTLSMAVMTALAGLAGAIGSATLGEAQAQTFGAPEYFEESFVGEAAATMARSMPSMQTFGGGGGRLLTGLRLGEPAEAARIDLAAMRVALPSPGSERLCLDLTTMDNRYTAESALPIQNAGGAPELGLASAYADALSGYSARDLLVRARVAQDCASTSASVLAPAVFDAGPLVASVNIGRGRPTAQLFKDGSAVTDKARCERDEQAAKSHDCDLRIDGLAGGVYELRIVVPSLIGADIEDSYDVALP